ncbi:whey acidic protein-like [Peromyscus californicus insignis]|uniref:whey acidic protein-like n=1 Tax=Peromyscus californicus insignis TaxID=564181 RepID=UPI0022A7A9C7|nr:whey acidic protein-like [Peromyscus californicus insignis]
MRCFISLALGLLALEVALAQNPLEGVFNTVQLMCPEACLSKNAECINCRTIAECAQNAACCPSSCSAICKTLVNTDVPKMGHCPWNPVNMIPAELCLQKSTCFRDSDCSGDMKCCRVGCAMSCQTPQAALRSTGRLPVMAADLHTAQLKLHGSCSPLQGWLPPGG